MEKKNHMVGYFFYSIFVVVVFTCKKKVMGRQR